ncbi:MAG TPA: 3-alpha-hydroxysteroid dehydrogenase [Porticoccaceae bacterium]|nr:3-alpha-hydroxysteroid dehydrogenase [Porticoccaceae bacterium]
MSSLEGKVALVTGAARGQGAAEAKLFAERGARVMLADVLDEEGKKTAAELGEAADYIHLDVTDESQWQAAVKATVAKFGKLTALVNNAGIADMNALTQMSVEQYMKTIQINQVGVFLGMKNVAGAMQEAGGGAIVNISSIAGMLGAVGGIAYCASKFAVRGMTKVAALELGPLNIRVNSIHPGGIMTRMLTDAGLTSDGANDMFSAAPVGRIGQPEEMAALAAYLISDDSSYSTGSEFVADGGLTAGFALE